MRKKEELLQTKRREKDIQRLLASKYEISPIADNNYDFYVRFTGPAGSPYEGVRYLSYSPSLYKLNTF